MFCYYHYSGNQLLTAKGLSYTYDANGNMKTDGIRGMTMAYNRLNLPQIVSKGSDVLAYGYSADGSKREKKFNGTTAQHYRGSIAYTSSGTPEYVLTPEGMVRNENGTWKRQYNLTDHLGNTRAVLAPNAAVLQQTDYYPFGTAFSITNIAENKYLYGGKELQGEKLGGVSLGLYDFEARYYNPMGIFTTRDPLDEKDYGTSPYAYCGNNPVNRVDPTGMDWYLHNETGDLRYFKGNDAQEGYTNIGKQVSINWGNGVYHNFYQGYGISSKDTPVDAYQYLVDNPSARTKAWKEGKISEDEKLEIYGAAIAQGRRDFATHPLVTSTVEGITFVITGGLDLGFAVGKGAAGLLSKGAARGSAQGFKSLGAAASNGFNRALQTGGHTLNNSTLKALGLTKEQGKIAIEALKRANQLPPNAHYKIMSNGDLINPHTGKFIDNLFDYAF